MSILKFGHILEFGNGRISKIYIKDTYNNSMFIDHEYFVKSSNICRNKELMFVIITLDYNLETDKIFIESMKNIWNCVYNYINNINMQLQLKNIFEENNNIYIIRIPLIGIVDDKNRVINETFYNKNNELVDINYLFEHDFEMWFSICIESLTIDKNKNSVELNIYLNEAFVKYYQIYPRRLNYTNFKNTINHS